MICAWVTPPWLHPPLAYCAVFSWLSLLWEIGMVQERLLLLGWICCPVAQTVVRRKSSTASSSRVCFISRKPPCPICYCSVANLCLTLCDHMDCSMPGFPVPHHLPEFAQVHVRWIGGAIQPPHPLSPSSPSAFNLSQKHGLFQKVGSVSGSQRIGASASASVLPASIPGWFPLGLTGLISLQSQESFGSLPSLWSSSHIHTWLPHSRPCHILNLVT